MVGRELHTLVCPLGEDHQGQGKRVWGGMGCRMEHGCANCKTATKTTSSPWVCVARGAFFSIRACGRGGQEEQFLMMHCTTTVLIQHGIPGELSITIIILTHRPTETTTMLLDLIPTRKSSSSNALSTASALLARAASPMSIFRMKNSEPLRARACNNFPKPRILRPRALRQRAAPVTTQAPAVAPAPRNLVQGPRSFLPHHDHLATVLGSRTASAATALLMTWTFRQLHRHQASAFLAQVPLHLATRHDRVPARSRGVRVESTP